MPCKKIQPVTPTAEYRWASHHKCPEDQPLNRSSDKEPWSWKLGTYQASSNPLIFTNTKKSIKDKSHSFRKVPMISKPRWYCDIPNRQAKLDFLLSAAAVVGSKDQKSTFWSEKAVLWQPLWNGTCLHNSFIHTRYFFLFLLRVHFAKLAMLGGRAKVWGLNFKFCLPLQSTSWGQAFFFFFF